MTAAKWVVIGEESGTEKQFDTKKEATEWLRGVKAFDKENGINDNWTIKRI